MAFILCMRLFMFYKGVLPEPGNTTVTAIISYAYSVSSIELLKNNNKIYIFLKHWCWISTQVPKFSYGHWYRVERNGIRTHLVLIVKNRTPVAKISPFRSNATAVTGALWGLKACLRRSLASPLGLRPVTTCSF